MLDDEWWGLSEFLFAFWGTLYEREGMEATEPCIDSVLTVSASFKVGVLRTEAGAVVGVDGVEDFPSTGDDGSIIWAAKWNWKKKFYLGSSNIDFLEQLKLLLPFQV